MDELRPFIPFPDSAARRRLSPETIDSMGELWTTLCYALLGLSDKDFRSTAKNDDEPIEAFLLNFVEEVAQDGVGGLGTRPAQLLKAVFQLSKKLLTTPSPPPQLLAFPFIADFAKIFPKKHTTSVISRLFQEHTVAVESSLSSLKKLLIPHLDAGIKGDLKLVEAQLVRLNPLLHISPEACTLFLAGSDFVDGLVTCYRVMNPPLRKAIITTMYLCLVGLLETEPPKLSMLGDQLYALTLAADAHKAGPINANDSSVSDLVTNTPLLKLILRKTEATGVASDNLKKRITALESFKSGAMVRPKRLKRRKVDKGKVKATQNEVDAEMHVHRMSQITQVQDLFPDLGAGFVSRCLEEYGEDVELVVANLLGESLPAQLANADRTEPL